MGQNETYLQAFSNLLLLNPTFAGVNNNTNFSTGNQYYYLSEEQSYNLFYASYDKPFNKAKGAYGVWLQHGTITQYNTCTSELGFTYSGFEKKYTNGSIKFSASTGIVVGSKQWFNYLLDNILVKKGEEASPPGKKFLHYYLLKPGLGFLGNFNTFTFGISGNYPLAFNVSHQGEKGYQRIGGVPINLSFYLSKKMGGLRHGLTSSPFETYPEIIVFYNNEFILSRASLNIKHIDKTFGVFAQSDFTNNVHCLGGTLAYRFKNTSIKLNAGSAIPGISNTMGGTFEISLNILIPHINYSEINPWAPQKK